MHIARVYKSRNHTQKVVDSTKAGSESRPVSLLYVFISYLMFVDLTAQNTNRGIEMYIVAWYSVLLTML